MRIQKLWENEWLTVNKYDGWYTAMKHRYNGVMVLPYRRREDGDYEILLRLEVTPCHGPHRRCTSITGMTDDPNLSFEETAIKELKEEGGYEVSFLDYEGPVYPSKASATLIQTFTVDLTGLEQGIIYNDGTEGEKGGSAEWYKVQAGLELACPMIGRCIARLLADRRIIL
jgi:8-oxo-dGTP pyrophosphatase MutT (NUDIX family)